MYNPFAMQPLAQIDAAQTARRLESARNILLNVASVLVGVLMLLLGALLTQVALPAMLEWDALSGALKSIIAIWIVAGPVALACGLWLLVSLGRRNPPLWTGACALSTSGALMVVGVLTHVIPCAGPT